jgi:HlyD family secretion protein
VGNIQIGKPVTFKVDAFPKETFQGVVKQVRMNPTTIQSVVTYDTIIEFANRDMKLVPGMTAYVTIPVATAKDVVKVPNTALRYKPPMTAEEILAIYKRYGIDGREQLQASADSASAASQTKSAAPAGSASQSEPRTPKTETAVVWKLHPDSSMEPVKISLGITDHAYTQVGAVLKGELKEGDEVVIRSIVSKNQTLGSLRR